MFRKALLIFPFILFSLCVSAQSKNEDAIKYIRKYAHIAIDNMREYNIPASITLSQGLLESGCGLSPLAKKSNNHFGIKCKNTWTGDRVFHDDDEAGECFRKYNCVEDSYADHALFLSSSQRYSPLFMLPQNDYKGWATGLKKAGYATNPKYPALLINMIELYELHKLDDPKSAKNFIASIGGKETPVKVTPKATPTKSDNLIAYYIMGGVNVYRDNKELYVIARKGETFESLAKSLKMNKKRLYKYNDNKEMKEGDKLFINKKRNKRRF